MFCFFITCTNEHSMCSHKDDELVEKRHIQINFICILQKCQLHEDVLGQIFWSENCRIFMTWAIKEILNDI